MAATAPNVTAGAGQTSQTGTQSVMSNETTQQLMKQAQDQAAQETQAAESPYQQQVTQYGLQQKQSVDAVNAEFATLLPQVQASASALTNAQGNAVAETQSVFQAAGQRLNALAQQQGAEAQQLAQQMGGPVASGQFTDALTPFVDAFPSVEGGSLLSAIGLGQAGTQEAQTFAGQVFPAMQTEQTAQLRNYFQDKISTANEAIAQLESQKSGLVNDKYTTLLQNERQFEIDKSNVALQKLHEAHAWKVEQAAIKNNQQRTGIAAVNASTAAAKAKAEAFHWTAMDRNAQQRNNISAAHYAALAQHYRMSDAIQQQKAASSARSNAMAYLDAAMGDTKTIEITQKQRLTGAQVDGAITALNEGKHVPNVWRDKNGIWWQYTNVHMTPQQWSQKGGAGGQHPITDPNQLYNLLIGAGFNPKMSQATVKMKTGLNDWSPGKNVHYDNVDLANMSMDELKGIAIQRGWRPHNSVKLTKQRIIDYITSRNPQQTGTGTPGG